MKCFLLTLLVIFFSGVSGAEPVIAIVIDDMGNSLTRGRQALALPGPVTYAFLPGAPHAGRLSREAYQLEKESIVHLPMEPLGDSVMETNGLTSNMEPDVLQRVVEESIAAVPYAVGINNHMGSLLTSQRAPMEQLMQALQRMGDIYFLDSKTHGRTVAEKVAREYGLPTTKRNIFLDNVDDRQHIERQFELLLEYAQREGTAVAIGHPISKTLTVLRQKLPLLEEKGIKLVPVSRLITQQKISIPSIVKLEDAELPGYQ